MKARSAKGEKMRLHIIQAAGDLFHAQGVAATSPDQVIEASETGKGQFYHYFKSKEGLVHAVLQNYLEGIRAGSNPAYFEIRGWKDLERWFLVHLELQKSFDMTRGCPFGTIGNGVTEKDELVRPAVERSGRGAPRGFLHRHGPGRDAHGQDQAQQQDRRDHDQGGAGAYQAPVRMSPV